jgi:hypothetical protein
MKKRNRTEYFKQYKVNLTPEQRAQQNARRRGHRGYNRVYTDKWRSREPIAYLLTKLRYRAKRDGIPFDLEPSDFVLPTHCPVLGIPITFPAPPYSPGLPTFDRSIPKLGYVKGNVTIISWRANTLKSDCIDAAELRKVADYIDRVTI